VQKSKNISKRHGKHCGRQKYDRHHLCKHLVQAVEPLHPRFWREVIRRRVKPAITLSRDPSTISDGDDHIGTVQYRKSSLIADNDQLMAM